MADIFDVVADPTRRELLSLLLARRREGDDASHGGEASVGELVLSLGLSQPTVSKHLKVLRESALVTVREQGQHRFYRLDLDPLEPMNEWLAPFRAEAGIVDAPTAAVPSIAARPVAALPGALRSFAETVGGVIALLLHRARGAVHATTVPVRALRSR